MKEGDLLTAVIEVSEKAANIARAIRQEDHLLSLLVREKSDSEKNPRFIHDFKTLADVLVQEVIKHDLGLKFPELIGNIYGEENNEFSCLDGENINLKVGQDETETNDLLLRILGDEKAAGSLAHLVHLTTDIQLDVPKTNLPIGNIGIWIDPIDSTAEYIAGGEFENMTHGMYVSGLPCVTVLIGAFQLDSGLPLLGVINQPFHNKEEGRWLGKVFWGVCHDDQRISSISNIKLPEERNVVVVSSSENEKIKSQLKGGGFTVIEAAGAGYKLLCVANGLASAYILSKPSTFFWDTCAVQALLTAQYGGVVNYKYALSEIIQPLRVSQGGQKIEDCCNVDGLIAYRDTSVLNLIVKLIHE